MISKVAFRLILFQSIQCASFSFLRLRKEKIILHCLFAHLPLGRSESESQIWFIIWLISQLEIQCCLTFSWEMLLCLQVQSLTGVIFTLDSQHSKWKISSGSFPCSYTAASIHLVCDPFFQVNNVLFLDVIKGSLWCWEMFSPKSEIKGSWCIFRAKEKDILWPCIYFFLYCPE